MIVVIALVIVVSAGQASAAGRYLQSPRMMKAQELVMQRFAGLYKRNWSRPWSRKREPGGRLLVFGDFLNPISKRHLRRIADAEKVLVVTTDYRIVIKGITRNKNGTRTIREVAFTSDESIQNESHHSPYSFASTYLAGQSREQRWSMGRQFARVDGVEIQRTAVNHKFQAGRQTVARGTLKDIVGEVDQHAATLGEAVIQDRFYPRRTGDAVRERPRILGFGRHLGFLPFDEGHVTKIQEDGSVLSLGRGYGNL